MNAGSMKTFSFLALLDYYGPKLPRRLSLCSSPARQGLCIILYIELPSVTIY